MEVSAFTSVFNSVNTVKSSLLNNANKIADPTTSDKITPLIANKALEVQFNALGKVVKNESDNIGTILDIMV